MGVVVRRYINILIILLILTPLVLALYCSSIPTSLFIFKCFIVLVYVIFVQYSKRAQRTFEIIQKSRLREHGDIIISTKTYVCRLCARMSPVISTCEVPRDISRKL